jgi:Protein of unknown function (DUF2971).
MSVYLFQDQAEFRLQSLEADKLWFSYRTCLNDPFDCRAELINDIDERQSAHGHDVDDLRSLFRKYYEGGLNGRWDCGLLNSKFVNSIVEWCDESISGAQLKIRLEELLDQIGVRCFFLNEPTNVLMWAHYAGNHKGYCVQYSNPSISFLPMSYSNTSVPIYISDLLFSSRAYINRVLNTKYSSWAYENETRITVLPSQNADIHNTGFTESLSQFRMQVEAIWLGLNVPEPTRIKLCDLCLARGWRVHEAMIDKLSGSMIRFSELDLKSFYK